MRRINFLLALIMSLGILMLMGTRLVLASDHVVTNCANDDELRADVVEMASGNGGTLTFSCGTATITLDSGSPLPIIYSNMTIDGGNKITLSGGSSTRLLHIFVGGTLTLKNITLTKGYVDDSGGAIYNDGTLDVVNSKFIDNKTGVHGNGGAIFSQGALNITNSEFASNQGSNGGALRLVTGGAVASITGSSFHDNKTFNPDYGYGGAIFMADGANVTIGNSSLNTNQARFGGAIYASTSALQTQLTIENNTTLNGNSITATGYTAEGGAIYNGGGIVTLQDVTLSGNTSTGLGGAVSNHNGTMNVSAGTFSTNSTDALGGAIFNSAYLTLTNSTLSANQAGQGGAIHSYYGHTTLTNVTLSGNSANSGGGIYSYLSVYKVRNTLIAKGVSGGNCGDSAGGGFGAAFSFSDDNSCNFAASGGMDGVNLLLGPLANNGGLTKTHLPGAGSPAIDGATNAGAPNIDQRGLTRVGQGAAYDAGSVEVQNVPPTRTPTRTLTRTLTPTATRTATTTRTLTPTRTGTPTNTCQAKPAKPTLKSPADKATLTTHSPTLKWNRANCAESYTVIVKNNVTGQVAFKKKNISALKIKTDLLASGNAYKWFVQGCNASYGCAKSITRTFTVQ